MASQGSSETDLSQRDREQTAVWAVCRDVAQDRIQDCFLPSPLPAPPPPPHPPLPLCAAATINNGDLSSLSQAACHWSLPLYRPGWLCSHSGQRDSCASVCNKHRASLVGPNDTRHSGRKCVWWTNPYLLPLLIASLWVNYRIFSVSLEASFHLMRFCTVRDLTVCCSSLCTHTHTRQALTYRYLIPFSLVNVLHNIMKRFCGGIKWLNYTSAWPFATIPN